MSSTPAKHSWYRYARFTAAKHCDSCPFRTNFCSSLLQPLTSLKIILLKDGGNIYQSKLSLVILKGLCYTDVEDTFHIYIVTTTMSEAPETRASVKLISSLFLCFYIYIYMPRLKLGSLLLSFQSRLIHLHKIFSQKCILKISKQQEIRRRDTHIRGGSMKQLGERK